MATIHVAMFPWFAIGHITPYLKLSNELAERGHRVSFFIPTKTLKKFNHLNLHPHLIQFIPLAITQIHDVPPGAETMSDVPLSKFPSVQRAFDLTKDQVESSLHKLKPDVVFFDFAHWIPALGKRLGFRSIYFSALSAVSCLWLVPANRPGNDEPRSKLELIEPPEIYPGSSSVEPLPIALKKFAPILTEYDGTISLRNRVYTSSVDSDALCFRACGEIEGPFVDYIATQHNKPLFLTGPLLREPSSDAILEEKWAKWLGGFKKGTVVYCAFGSECVMQKDQFQELVLGLELTGLPFLVRVKPPEGYETVEEALPEGFEERVRKRGVVYGGWDQQPLILDHPSVGCFVGHCGVGSMWESLITTCQLVLIPQRPDQFRNTEFMSKGLKVAVDVERRGEDGWFTKESVCKAVKLVMDEESKVGKEARANHKKWKELLLAEGFESSYIDNFIKKLQDFLT